MSRPNPQTRPEIAALQAALAAEQAAAYGYGVVGAHLLGTRFAAASADYLAHERARDSLTAMIVARGVRPHPAAAAYRMPVTVNSTASAKSLAIVIERQVAAAYVGLVAVSDPALRQFGAEHMRAAAVRSARWGGRPQAFPGLPSSSLIAPGHG
jgi:hypothetical protein